ncbi:MAG TPA: ribonuclease H, partial [Coriobacteriia bacterium]|nr:ribonuclease H [Coriobacteriia bacterium]
MTERKIEKATLNTDGGSRGNPGESGIGFIIRIDADSSSEVVCRGGAYIGTATNNIAEYRALIWGLRNAAALGVKRIEVLADSELMVKQVRGEYKVKNEGIKPLFVEVLQLLRGFESFAVGHVLRAENAAADELANQAMDEKASVGDYLVDFESNELF